jgi:DtxR family transcriptional regulator, Mn-dependent transcriptional regulator
LSTPAIEEYLELLYRLDADASPVRPAALARGLGVSTAAVAEMLARLETEQLVERSEGRTVQLTRAGTKLGRGQVRKHRLAERLLHGILKRPWDAVHEEACRFEHVMSDELTESLVKALGDPTTCPHGNPIPTLDGDAEAPLVDSRESPLAGCRVGQTVVVSRIVDEQRDVLHYLLSLGVLPGVELLVEQVAPFGGPLLIQVGEARYAVGRDVAERIRVVPTVPAVEPALGESAPAYC